MKNQRKTLSCKRTKKQMLVILTSVVLLMAPVMGQAQTNSATKSETTKDDKPLLIAEKIASFPGGLDAMMKFLYQSVRYPFEAAEKGIQGTVITKFVVDKEGNIGDISVVRGLHPALDAEAVRVVKSMPRWIPAQNKGENVAMYFTLPIRFSLKENKLPGQSTPINRTNENLPASKYRLPYFGKAKVLPGNLSDGIRFRIDDGAFTAEVLSAREGVVTVLNRNEKEGAVVELKHTDGETTQYAHLGTIALSLHLGDTVKAGGLIGFQGKLNSDNQSNQLHFTIRDKNNRCDTVQLRVVRKISSVKEPVKSSENYSLVAFPSGKCIDIPNGSGVNGRELILYARNEGPNQHWSLKKEGDYYKIISEHNRKAITVALDESSKKALIVQEDNKETDAQLWTVKEFGHFRAFYSKLNGQALLPATGDTLMQLKQADDHTAGVWAMKPAENIFAINKETLSPAEMKADLDELIKTLANNHPDMYAYTTKEKFNQEVAKLRQSISQPLPYREFFSRMIRLNKLFDGHTNINPIVNCRQTLSYLKAGGFFFPHQVRVENGKLFLSFGQNDSSKIEVLSINRIPAGEILTQLGQTTNYEKQKMNDWNVQSNFGLILHGILNIQGPWFEYETRWHQSGMKANTIEQGITAQNLLAGNTRYYDRNEKFQYRSFEKESIALIEYNTCPMNEEGIKDLDAFLVNSFNDIKEKGIRNLFIDVSRNGGGGGDEVNSLLYNKLNHQARNWQSVMYKKVPDRAKLDTIPVPQCTNMITDGFDGNVYLIQSGYTYSAAVGVSAWFKFSGRGKVIGEETGGTTAAYVYAPVHQLPNSKILYQVSNTLWKFPFGARKDQGILPDVPVSIDYSKPHFELNDLKEFLIKVDNLN
ncbi:MAG: TonB family protein [Bacteroidota bacterium]|nr:TonB family protein [Bacteroidota bacterium]